MKKFLLLAVCVLALHVTLYTLHGFCADKGLVAYWSFDEGSGDEVKDKSGNGMTGTINNAAFEKGRAGSCLSFNGSDAFVSVEDIEKLNFENNPSVFLNSL